VRAALAILAVAHSCLLRHAIETGRSRVLARPVLVEELWTMHDKALVGHVVRVLRTRDVLNSCRVHLLWSTSSNSPSGGRGLGLQDQEPEAH
jgi:hypothetical protein